MHTLTTNSTPLPLLALASGPVWVVPVPAAPVQAPAVPLPAEDDPPAPAAGRVDVHV